jgi:hypothetical protein
VIRDRGGGQRSGTNVTTYVEQCLIGNVIENIHSFRYIEAQILKQNSWHFIYHAPYLENTISLDQNI